MCQFSLLTVEVEALTIMGMQPGLYAGRGLASMHELPCSLTRTPSILSYASLTLLLTVATTLYLTGHLSRTSWTFREVRDLV